MYFSHLFFLAILLAVVYSRENEFFKSNAAKKSAPEQLLEEANELMIESRLFQNFAYWNFTVNMTDLTQDIYIRTELTETKIWRPLYQKALIYTPLDLSDPSMQRQLEILQRPTFAVLSDDDYATYLRICTDMERLYAEALFCSYEDEQNCNLQIHSDLLRIFAEQRDADELKYYWKVFYDRVSLMKSHYLDLVYLHKRALQAANFESLSEWWFAKYEPTTINDGVEDYKIQRELDAIWKSIKPFYLQLHAYVRYRLYLYYGKEHVSLTGPIPMHLLGSLWGEEWSNIQNIIVPYRMKGAYDVSKAMPTLGYDVKRMFKTADDFMASMGLQRLPKTLWSTCIGSPNTNLNIYCRPRSFDFYKNDDVCVRSCTFADHKGFQSVYQEMGHLQYFLQYANKPFLLRDSPSPDLHEAIGNVMALSAMAPAHLQELGLLSSDIYDHEARINYLFRVALEKIVFIPFALSADEFHWSFMRGELASDQLNCEYWRKRQDYTGVRAPVERNKSFDVFANYYIAGDVELLRFVKAIIVEFQLYKAACEITRKNSVESNYLENCNFYENQKVGEAFQTLMSTGAEENWVSVLSEFGLDVQEHSSHTALMEYFQPLIDWLEETNRENNVTIGWLNAKECKSTNLQKLQKLSNNGNRVKVFPEGLVNLFFLTVPLILL